MKNIMYTIVFSSLTILSCSSDNNVEDAIVGSWKGTGSTFNSMVISAQKLVKIKSNGRTEFISISENGDISQKGEWIRNGDTLTITWDNGNPETIFQINDLTKNSLRWQSETYDEYSHQHMIKSDNFVRSN